MAEMKYIETERTGKSYTILDGVRFDDFYKRAMKLSRATTESGLWFKCVQFDLDPRYTPRLLLEFFSYEDSEQFRIEWMEAEIARNAKN